MSVTVQWLVGVAAGLTAFGVIWRKGVRPTWRFGRKVKRSSDMVIEAAPPLLELSKVAPVLLEIARDFQVNGGGSLRDTIDRIEVTLDERAVVFERMEQAAIAAAAAVPEVAAALAGETRRLAVALAGKVEEAARLLAASQSEDRVAWAAHMDDDRASFARIEERQSTQPRIETVEQAATRVEAETPPLAPKPDVP